MAQNLKLYTWEEVEKILTMWSKEQEEWANDYWMPDKAEQKGYKKAMRHLRHKLKNPITYII